MEAAMQVYETTIWQDNLHRRTFGAVQRSLDTLVVKQFGRAGTDIVVRRAGGVGEAWMRERNAVKS
jgi:hypothetical protein